MTRELTLKNEVIDDLTAEKEEIRLKMRDVQAKINKTEFGSETKMRSKDREISELQGLLEKTMAHSQDGVKQAQSLDAATQELQRMVKKAGQRLRDSSPRTNTASKQPSSGKTTSRTPRDYKI